MQDEKERKVVVNMKCTYTRSAVLDAFRSLSLSPSRFSILTDLFKPSREPRGDEDEEEEEEERKREKEKRTEIEDDVELQWDDYEDIDWTRVLSGKMIASAYCHRKGLIRKAQLAVNVSRWLAKRPESILKETIPQTLVLELNYPDELDEALINDIYEISQMKEGEDAWILKPSLCNQGSGIEVFDSVQRLRDIVEDPLNEDVKEWVIQKYIRQPFLVDGRKFHFRVYVLAIGSLHLFVFKDVLSLFSLSSYDPVSLKDPAVHLTNTCFQKASGSFDEDKAVRLMWEMAEELGGEEKVKKIFEDIKKITAETFTACSQGVGFFPLPNCFELFGLDFLLDQDQNVFLLEINAEPDFLQTGSRLRSIVQTLASDAVLLLNHHFFSPSGSVSSSSSSSSSGEEAVSARPETKWDLVLELEQEGYKSSRSTISFS